MNHEKPAPKPIRADTYLRSIYASPLYQDTLNSGNFSVQPFDTQQKIRNQALGKAANFLVKQNTSPNEYVTPEGSLYKMMGQLGSFYHAQKELDRMKDFGHVGNRDAVRAQKEKLIHFNHSLRDVIDKHPNMDAQELLRFMGVSYEHLHGSETINDFIHEARRHVIGMQHEVLAEQIMGSIDDDNFSYEESDLNGELTGADYYVTIDNFRFGVDIKSSPTAMDNSIADHGRTTQLWSGVPQKKIGGRFRLTYEEAAEYAVDMRERLLQIAERTRLAQTPNNARQRRRTS